MFVTAKATIGYDGRAWLNSWSDDAIIKGGKLLTSKRFTGFKKGDKVKIVFNITRSGKRMIRAVMTDPDAVVAVAAPTAAGTPISPEVTAAANAAFAAMAAATVTVDPVVTKSNGYFIDQEARLAFTTAKQMSDRNPDRAVKVMMIGPSGYGKTTLPRLFAQRIGYGFMRMNCATIRDSEEWFGFREAKDGSTTFIRSAFANAIEAGNLVVVLDEFNRLEPWLHNTLFPLLDEDGRTTVHDEEFVIGPNVIIVGTINTGYKFTGTFELDEALLNRFNFVLEVGPMPSEEEVKVLTTRTKIGTDDAKAIVRMSNILRQQDIVCSTRSTLMISEMVSCGMTIREAFENAVVRRIPADSTGMEVRKALVDKLNIELRSTVKTRVVKNDVFETDTPVVEPTPAIATIDTPGFGKIVLKEANQLEPIQKLAAMAAIRKLYNDGYIAPVTMEEITTVTNTLMSDKSVTFALLKEFHAIDAVWGRLADAGIAVLVTEEGAE